MDARGRLWISLGVPYTYVYDTQGRGYIEGMSGLWCAGLGFGDEEMIDAAIERGVSEEEIPGLERHDARDVREELGDGTGDGPGTDLGAQGTTGSITGRVVDSTTQQPVANATGVGV